MLDQQQNAPGKHSSFHVRILRQMIECLVSKDPHLAKLIVFADGGLAVCRPIDLYVINSIFIWRVFLVSFFVFLILHLLVEQRYNNQVGCTG